MSNETWKAVFEDFKLPYRQRSISQALITLCMFHDERRPSFWAYPSGDYYCYGCAAHGTINDFTPELRQEFEQTAQEELARRQDWAELSPEDRYQAEQDQLPPF